MADLSQEELMAIAGPPEVSGAGSGPSIQELMAIAGPPGPSVGQTIAAGASKGLGDLLKAPGNLLSYLGGVGSRAWDQSGKDVQQFKNPFPIPDIAARGLDAVANVPMQMAGDLVHHVANQSPFQTAADAAMVGTADIPLVGPTVAAGGKQVANALDEALLGAPPTSNMDKLRGASEAFTGTGVPNLAIGATRGVLDALPENLQNIGRAEYKTFTESANRPGVLANILNVPAGTTNAKAQQLLKTAPLEDHLLQSGVLKGLDTSKMNRADVMQEFIDKTGDLKTNGMRTKEALLDLADKKIAEGGSAKIELPSIDRRGLNDLINKDLETPFTQQNAAAGEAVSQDLQGAFQRDTGLFTPDSPQNPNVPGEHIVINKSYNVSELRSIIQGVDKKLEELGTWDRSRLAKAMADPSAYANIRGRLDALREVRSSLNDALTAKVGEALGSDAAALMAKSNMDIQTGIEFSQSGKLFQIETGQGLTPGSGRAGNVVGGGLSRQLGGEILGKVREGVALTDSLSRESEAIRRMQIVGQGRDIPGYHVRPPNIHLVVGGINRAADDLQPLLNTMVLHQLSTMGAVTPDEVHNGVNVNTLPPEAVQQAVPAAYQALTPYMNAMEYGTKEDQQQEASKLMTQFPQAFPPPKTGIPGEIEVDGKPMLVNPQDRLLLQERIKRSGMSPNQQTKVLNEMFLTGKVTKVPK